MCEALYQRDGIQCRLRFRFYLDNFAHNMHARKNTVCSKTNQCLVFAIRICGVTGMQVEEQTVHAIYASMLQVQIDKGSALRLTLHAHKLRRLSASLFVFTLCIQILCIQMKIPSLRAHCSWQQFKLHFHTADERVLFLYHFFHVICKLLCPRRLFKVPRFFLRDVIRRTLAHWR